MEFSGSCMDIMSPNYRDRFFRQFDFQGLKALYHIGSNSIFEERSPFFKLFRFLNGDTANLDLSDDELEKVTEQWQASQSWHRPKIDDTPLPITQIAISPTMKCNLSCNYCYNFQELPEAKVRKLPSLESSGIRKILKTLDKLQVDSKVNVAFIGGEPLINIKALERLIRITRRAAATKNIGVKFLATTNGLTLGRPGVLDLVNKYRIGVSVSLDGPREWHNETRHLLNGSDSYDKIMRSVEKFLSGYHSPYKSVRATYRLAPGRLIGTYRHMRDLGFNDIAMGSFEFDNKMLSSDVTQELFQEISTLSREIESDMVSGKVARHSWLTEIFINLFTGNVKQVICGATRNHVAFDVFGKMQACHRYLGNEKYELSAQDILDRSGSTLLPTIMQHSKTKHCSACWARSLCGGECFHVAKEINLKDNASALQDQICNFKRHKFREGIRAYTSIMSTHPEIMPALVYGLTTSVEPDS